MGKIELFFTTVDGSSSKFPLYQKTSDGIIFSGEARPVSSNSSSFETDYAMYSYVLGEWIEFGRAVFKLPSTDSDNNGLLDILQYNKSGNFTTSGTGYVHAPASETTKLTGTFSRSKNNDVGNYSVYIESTGGRRCNRQSPGEAPVRTASVRRPPTDRSPAQKPTHPPVSMRLFFQNPPHAPRHPVPSALRHTDWRTSMSSKISSS